MFKIDPTLPYFCMKLYTNFKIYNNYYAQNKPFYQKKMAFFEKWVIRFIMKFTLDLNPDFS